MGTDLSPIEEVITSSSPLGYKGIQRFHEVDHLLRTQIGITQTVSEALTRNGFQLYTPKEVIEMRRSAEKRNAQLRAKQRSYRLKYEVPEGNREIALYTGGFAFMSGCLVPIVAKLVLIMTMGWSADLPVLIAIGCGVGVPVIAGLLAALYLYLWNMTSLPLSVEVGWHKIPIAEYLPSMSPDTYERLEQLHQDLSTSGVSAEFFILHGTANKSSSVTKEPNLLTAKVAQLKQWREEAGLVQLDVKFPDGEVTTITIAPVHII